MCFFFFSREVTRQVSDDVTMRMSPLPRLVLVAAVTLLASANANAEISLHIDTNTTVPSSPSSASSLSASPSATASASPSATASASLSSVTLASPSSSSSSDHFKTVNREQVVAGVEASLLSLLGFEKRPNPQGSAHVPESLKKLQARQNSIGTADIAKPGIHARSANTVRSFSHVGECRFFYIFFRFTHTHTQGEVYEKNERNFKMSKEKIWKNLEFF